MAGPTSPLLIFIINIIFWLRTAQAGCLSEFAFNPPSYSDHTLNYTFNQIQRSLDSMIKQDVFKETSFALEISSSKETLFSSFHTMPGTAGNNPTSKVDGSTAFRIESNTKLFTSMGILRQEALGHLNLDDSVSKYVQGLPSGGNAFDWESVTIRAILGQMSGLPDSLSDDDLLEMLSDPTALGLPPVSDTTVKSLPQCAIFSNYTKPCIESDLVQALSQYGPMLPPQVEATYSNIGYDLLGLVLANVTGMDYEDYISSSILQPLGLNDTSFTPPAQSAAKLPYPSAWGQVTGVDAATGGLYSSSSDMILFLQHCLQNRRKITPSIDWFSPVAYSVGQHSFFGYTWEIFRTSSILPDSAREVTFVTKGGGGAEYYSYSLIISAYDLVVFMVAAGDLSALNSVFATVRNTLVIGAEQAAQQNLKINYAGTYSTPACKSSACSQNPPHLNSSITLTQSSSRSLYISAWISNSTDALQALLAVANAQSGQTGSVYFQFTPMFRNVSSADGSRTGEVWRFINVIDDAGLPTNSTNVWDDYCVSNLDPLRYGGVSINEVVFWREGASAAISEIQIPVFQVVMGRENV